MTKFVACALLGLSLAVPSVAHARTDGQQQVIQPNVAKANKAQLKQQKKANKARQKAIKNQQKELSKYKKAHGVQH